MKITVTYEAKWQLIICNNYKWTECKKLINTKTGKEISKTLKGCQLGYYINRKFIKLSEMKNMVDRITEDNCPF